MSKPTNLRRFAVKCKLIEIKGGKCLKCGYDRCKGALDFHHRDPEEKRFSINHALNFGKNWNEILKEVEKCDLLCSNCHRETEYKPPYEGDIKELFEQFKRKKRKEKSKPRSMSANKKELSRLLKEHSIRSVAKMFSVSERTVEFWREKWNIKIERRHKADRIPSKIELQELISKHSASKIGSIFGVSGNSVKKWLAKYELTNPRSNKYYKGNIIDW